MQYLLMIYDDEKILGSKSPDERATISAEYLKYTQEIKASGHFLGGDALQPSHTATTVRVRDGKQTTTDGPFAETREVLGGYYLVEAANLDEAIKLAARIPSSKWGSIEVRPIWSIPNMGPKS
ncbi:MAG TPA: YciI family protein [Kofleriaceae bacterium]|jgi:hypothetical protein